MCLAGFLDGLDPMEDFNFLTQLTGNVYFSFFGNSVFGSPSFPSSDIPLKSITDDVACDYFSANPSRIFQFKQISEAHNLLKFNQANGKLVVVV